MPAHPSRRVDPPRVSPGPATTTPLPSWVRAASSVGLVSVALPPDIEDAVARVVAVAQAAPGTVAVALVGSWARGAGCVESDLDIVVLSEKPERWLDSHDWIEKVATDAALTSAQDFGALQERRLRLPTGLEIEIGIGRPTWGSTTPMDRGTRRVASDALHALWDPSGLLRTLLAALADER
jgi:predicted nucleotidyltransferase